MSKKDIHAQPQQTWKRMKLLRPGPPPTWALSRYWAGLTKSATSDFESFGIDVGSVVQQQEMQ